MQYIYEERADGTMAANLHVQKSDSIEDVRYNVAEMVNGFLMGNHRLS